MRTTSIPANYRIYDRTGGGATEDIYAESLEDAIEQGRNWIEAGDWEQGDDEETLDCAVAKIVRIPDISPIESALSEYAVELDDKGSIVTTIIAADLAAGDLDKITAELAGIATVAIDGTDADGDTIVVITPTINLAMIIDEDATWHADRHDCSGTLPAKDAPECIDDETEHDWQSPYSVLGGCKENPGVWGSGHGQVMIKSVCSCCGMYRTTDYGATSSHDGTQTTRTSYEPADEASIAWLMRRLCLPSEIEVKGVTVSLEWDETADIRQDDDEIGEAVHTVDEAELDAGIAPGPNDGDVIKIEGIKFRLGSHDYETNGGQVTCSAKIYRVL